MSELVTFNTATVKKIVRNTLKGRFPDTKFDIRKKGRNLFVSWTEGPPKHVVDAILRVFYGELYDIEVDYRYTAYSWVFPNNTALSAGVEGSTCAGGSHEKVSLRKPHPEAVKTSFDIVVIDTERFLSEEKANAVKKTILEEMRRGENPETPDEAIIVWEKPGKGFKVSINYAKADEVKWRLRMKDLQEEGA